MFYMRGLHPKILGTSWMRASFMKERIVSKGTRSSDQTCSVQKLMLNQLGIINNPGV